MQGPSREGNLDLGVENILNLYRINNFHIVNLWVVQGASGEGNLDFGVENSLSW